MTETYSDLLIRIGPLDTERGTYPVEAELDDGAMFVGGELRLDVGSLAATPIWLDPSEYGFTLFEALFAGTMRRAYERAFGQATARADGRTRVRLWIDDAASELQGLAWEGMYHMRDNRRVPLVVSTLTPFSRYAGLPRPAPPAVPAPAKGRPIRMLFAVASPSDLEGFGLTPLDVGQEVGKLRNSVGRLQQSGLLTTRVLVGNTGLSSSLRQELEQEGYEIADGPLTLSSLVRQMSDCHVVHLMCHGATSRNDDVAGLVLEDADGRARITKDQELVQALAGAEQLPRLLFLMSGDSPRGHSVNPHVRLGKELVSHGIPAVIVMQDVITIEGASLVTSAFYDSLLRHGYADAALSEARLYLFNSSDRTRSDWLMPVLFTNLKTGQLISFEKKSLPHLADLLEDVEIRAVAKSPTRSAATADTVVTDLTQRFRHLAERLRQLHILVDLANQLRQMQEGFTPCVMLVQQAGADLAKIQVAPLTWVWQPVRNSTLKRLELFLQQYSDLRVDGWYPPLMEQASMIDTSLNDFNFGALARSVTTFNRQLTEAEPAVRQQLDQAIAELVSFSDQTLGRLGSD